MLLVDCIRVSSIQSFNLVAIDCLQGTKYSDVTGLELMGSIRGNTVQDDAIFKVILQDFERLVCPEAVAYQIAWLIIYPCFRLGIKHSFKPLQTDLKVGESGLGARIMLSRGGVYGPVATMGCDWPDDHWEKRSTVSRYALDRSYDRPLDTRASIISRVVLIYQDFNGAEHT
jgi:hypothetical protein